MGNALHSHRSLEKFVGFVAEERPQSTLCIFIVIIVSLDKALIHFVETRQNKTQWEHTTMGSAFFRPG